MKLKEVEFISKKTIKTLLLCTTLATSSAYAMNNSINGKWECIDNKQKMYIYVDDNRFELEQKGERLVKSLNTQFTADPSFKLIKEMKPNFKMNPISNISNISKGKFLLNFGIETNMEFNANGQPKMNKTGPIISKKTKPFIKMSIDIRKIANNKIQIKDMAIYMLGKKIKDEKFPKTFCKKVNWF